MYRLFLHVISIYILDCRFSIDQVVLLDQEAPYQVTETKVHDIFIQPYLIDHFTFVLILLSIQIDIYKQLNNNFVIL